MGGPELRNQLRAGIALYGYRASNLDVSAFERWMRRETMHYLGFAILIVSGFAAYWFRGRTRFGYGCLEIAAAIGLSIIAVFHPEPGRLLLSNGTAFGTYLSNALSYVASVYLMVRGLDNVGSDLPVRWRPTWARLFQR